MYITIYLFSLNFSRIHWHRFLSVWIRALAIAESLSSIFPVSCVFLWVVFLECVCVVVVTIFVSVLSLGADFASDHLDVFPTGAAVKLVHAMMSPAHAVSCTSLILHVHAEIHPVHSKHLQATDHTHPVFISPYVLKFFWRELTVKILNSSPPKKHYG